MRPVCVVPPESQIVLLPLVKHLVFLTMLHMCLYVVFKFADRGVVQTIGHDISRGERIRGVKRAKYRGFLRPKGPGPARIQETGYDGVSRSSSSAHHTRKGMNTGRK